MRGGDRGRAARVRQIRRVAATVRAALQVRRRRERQSLEQQEAPQVQHDLAQRSCTVPTRE